MDGDGDLDILATSIDDISWWENTTGRGDVLVRHEIADQFLNVGYVNAGDIDNDGDIDVVGSTFSTSSLLWWENLDGSASAWSTHVIGGNPRGEQVELVDIDGDGDLDAITQTSPVFYGEINVFTNESGDGSTWSGRTLSVEHYTNYTIDIADADTDGKPDLLVASEDYGRENGKQFSFFNLSTFGSSGRLTSSILDGGMMPGWGAMTWDADVPAGTSLTVEVRASNDAGNLGAFVVVPDSGTNLAGLIDSNARYIQYRASLTGVPDASPVIREVAIDRAGNGVGLVLNGPEQGIAGAANELVAHSEQIGARVAFAGSFSTGQTPIPQCPGVFAGLAAPRIGGTAIVDATGQARLSVFVPNSARGRMLYFQALDLSNCVTSNVAGVPFQ